MRAHLFMECDPKCIGSFVILVTGMKLESRIAKIFGSRFKPIVSGSSQYKLEEKIKEAINEGGKAIISYGIAGGLQPDLKSGTIIVGSQVIDQNQIFMTDLKWRSFLSSSLKGSLEEKVIGVNQPVMTQSEKENLYVQSRCVTVDMESHIAARTAKAHGLPFVILRVVADEANRDLPEFAREAIKYSGTINYFSIILSILRNPKQLGNLMVLILDLYRALRGLLRCNRLLGQGFGFFDL